MSLRETKHNLTSQGNDSIGNRTTLCNFSFATNGTNSNGGNGGSSAYTNIIVLFSFLGLLAFLITLTNSSVIYFVFKKRYLKTTTNIILASLASSDLLAGVLAIPLIVACAFEKGVCTAMDITSRFIAFSTVLHLLVVTLERYVMIVHAMRYRIWVNKRRTRCVLTFIWLFAAFSSLIQLSWIDLGRNNGARKEATRINDLIYSLVTFIGIVIFSLLIMAVSLCRIFVVVKRQLRDIKRLDCSVEKPFRAREKKIQRKAAIIFSAMLFAFIVCWFVYFLESIRFDLKMQAFSIPFWGHALLVVLRFSTALINPLLYTYIKEDFKRAMNLPFLRYEEVPVQSSFSRSTTVGTTV